MNNKEATRLVIYVVAASTAAVIAILAYLRGDTAMVTVALAWIATNIIATWNLNHTSKSEPEAPAEGPGKEVRGDHAA